ncbi:Na(+)/H(+) exchange regulatory cofactor NHE-RF3 [Echinococcus granulosus]|uniref:Pdz domain containing protein n=2 Tax=Echinococcus granulosus TaxID=6210 RepID=A0A068WCP0_ECHGR|nr:Na(+)/H(+) exchange regulatory cofactor NHE-RF3 [Echinococcus granulosus]CDS17505.1 pdz domain containing protein [Echinococcus granulosus]
MLNTRLLQSSATALMESLPSARIVHLYRWQSTNGYGFVLREDKSKKEFCIKSVEAGLPAEAAGIMANDCVIEVNGHLTSSMTYDGVVQEIKRDPQKVVLMLLQPYEKKVLKRRGVELSSKTCFAQIVNGRRERDDTTRMIREKMASDTISKSLLNCDAETAAMLNKQRLDLLSSL